LPSMQIVRMEMAIWYLSYRRQDPEPSQLESHRRQVLSKMYPKTIGPGILPTSLIMLLCSPRARDFSSSETQRRITKIEGIAAKKVRKMPMNWMTTKSHMTPQLLSQEVRSAVPVPSAMQAQAVKLFPLKLFEQPARQGERYIKESEPHTGSNLEVEHEQSALQEETKDRSKV